MHLVPPLLIATVALAVAFAGVFAIARRLNNYGAVDIAWSYAFGFLALGYALALDGWVVRRALLAVMVGFWSLRLGTHLLRRVARQHPKEDERYRQLRTQWSSNFRRKMMGFFQVQALSVALLGLPFLIAAGYTEERLRPVEIIGLIVWFLAAVGEGIADAQLSRFKRSHSDASLVCDVGLWRYSRHPNYFFEWMIWVGYALFALSAPLGWLSIISPLGILWLLLRVTGIPMTEEQSIRSKGDAYRRYQKTTSVFVPWFPRSV